MPLVIATMLRGERVTRVHTRVRQLRRYLEECCRAVTLVTPSSCGQVLTVTIFGFRRVSERCSRSACVVWCRYWHEVISSQRDGRKLARGVSNDQSVARALKAGASRAKLTGAGDGFLLVIRPIKCPIKQRRAVRQSLADIQEFPVKLDHLGSRVVLNVLRDIWG